MRGHEFPILDLLRAAGAAALVALSPATPAQDASVDTSDWKCTKCPFEEGKLDADIEAGAQYVDGTQAKFGDFTGLDEDGGYAVLEGTAGVLRENGTYWAVTADDLGLDTRTLSLEGGMAGRAEFALDFEQLPHTIFDTTVTPFTQADAESLALPAGFARAGTTQAMTTLDASLNPLDVGYDRDTLAVAGDVQLNKRWSTAIEYVHQERDGSTRGSGSFGFSALEFAQPLEDSTDGVVLALAYGSELLTGRLAYEASFYSNEHRALAWDNPYLGSDAGQMQPAPDSDAQHLDLSLVYSLAEHTTVSARVAVGRHEQDDDFLPYSTDPTLAPGPLPRTSLEGEVETTNFGLVIATDAASRWNVLEGLRLRADVRYDERDNTTPQDAYEYVVTDIFPAGPVSNLPYGSERSTYGLSGTWNLRYLLHFLPADQHLQVSGAWRHEDMERTFQDTGKTSEDSGWGRVQYRPFRWLDLAVKLGSGKREADDYQATSLLDAPQNPLMRKFYLAGRERDFADAEISLSPKDTLTFSLTGRYAEDDYFESQVGLQASRAAGATFFGSWAFGESAASLSAHYGWDEIDSRQAGSSAFGTPDWSGTTEDTQQTGGITLRLPRVTPQLALDVDLYFANTDADVITSSNISPAGALPQLRTRMNGVELTAEYGWSPALTLRAGLRYEHFDADDWQLDGVQPATVSTLLSLAADAYDYDVKLIEFAFIYRFGVPPAEAEKAAEPQE